MIEPSLALQTAIRAHLAADLAVTADVPADRIRAGLARPENLPAIMIGDGHVLNHGHAAGAQYVAGVFLDLHIWTLEDGQDRAKTIGASVGAALLKWSVADDFELDEFKVTRVVWPRDPDPQYGHGVLSIEAVVRWKL